MAKEKDSSKLIIFVFVAVVIVLTAILKGFEVYLEPEAPASGHMERR